MTRHALIVRGGWEGHAPVEATELFVPYLKDHDYQVAIQDTLDVYTDPDTMAGTDLIVQCWTQGQITDPQVDGLRTAVAAGTGLAGWHGGIVDAFRSASLYLHLTGGQFADHPGGFVDHEITVVPDRADHPIVAGIDRVRLHTEQYWVLSDPANDVLATTTHPAGPGTPWPEPVTVPAVWTRRWGHGRVFVCTAGHRVADLEVPEITAIVQRGLLWASR
jgi:type 1 glutamine amidotransferase